MSRTFRRGRVHAYTPPYEWEFGIGRLAPRPKSNSLPLRIRDKRYRDSNKNRPWKCTCNRCGCDLTHRHERAKLCVTAGDHEMLTDRMLNQFRDESHRYGWIDHNNPYGY